MEAIKLKNYESSLEYSNAVVDKLISHVENNELSKVDFDNVIQPAFDSGDYVEVHVYENHIGDYNWFCGGPCTAMNETSTNGDFEVQTIRRVTPLTTGVTVGSKSERSNDYAVALMSPFSGRTKKNAFTVVANEVTEISFKNKTQVRSFAVHSLHIYLGK